MIFTDDATKRYEEYSSGTITSTDDNIGIRYTSEEIVGDTVLLLRYNCPDPTCDFAGLGWQDLQRHVRSTHHKKMCDLCIRNKKVFTHEQELFTDKEHERHMRHGDDKPGALDQTGFKGHPLCAFCGERFYDDDKLYEHCRNKHERCFICDRRDSRHPHYYLDYNALEQHFKSEHFLCLDRECLEKKFVVFESEMDLKAHQLSEHANSLSKDVRRDARIVDLSGFDYRPSYQQERRGGGGGGSSREGRGGGRGRDPNAEPLPMSSTQPLRRDEMAFQRTMAIHSAQSLTTRTFGGSVNSTSNSAASRLNAGGSGQATSSRISPSLPAVDNLNLPDPAPSASTPLAPEDHARLARHGAVIERASNLLGNDAAKITSFRNNISLYNKGSLAPRNLVDALLAVFAASSSNAVGTVVREVADLFEDTNKGEALRKVWNDWRAINEDYPSLPSLDGMRGATTSSSGWAAAAAATPVTTQASLQQQLGHTTRVLRLKNATRRGSAASSSSSSTVPGAVYVSSAPITTAAGSGALPIRASLAQSAFPALPTSNPASSSASASAPRMPLWATPSAPAHTTAARTAPASAAPRPSLNSEESFPALPAAPKPLTTIFGYGTGRSVRRDFAGFGEGARGSAGASAWGTGGSGSGSAAGRAADADADGDADGTAEGGKKKKGRQGKKQVLVQWG